MPHSLNTTFGEFMRALARPNTYNITKNKHIVFGMLLGLLFPILMIWLDFYISGDEFSLEELGRKFVEHPFHYLFIFIPFVTGVIFGAFGTIRRENNERIAALIEQLQLISNTDTLTELYNRRYFEAELEKEFQRASRTASPFAIVSIDLDNLKAINDTCGHPAGDRVLQAIGKIARGNCRLYDVPARLGGDEFVVLLPNTTMAHSVTFAQRLCDQIAGHDFSLEGVVKKRPVTVSVGVASYPEQGQEVSVVMQAADKALYEAKRRGRNQIVGANTK
jgi:diguanylate cyclase (GGDEF)-like protein